MAWSLEHAGALIRLVSRSVVTGFVYAHLLAMGAYSHSPLRSLLLGSRTNELLRAARVATLLLR